MTFLYAIPGEDNNSFDLKKLDLEYAFESGPQRGLLRDAFGASQCALLTDGSVSPRLAQYNPKEQTWRKCGDFHIGFWTDSPPQEKDLRRSVQLKGLPVVLGGQEWSVPMAVTFLETKDGVRFDYTLSRYIDHDDDGELVLGDVEEKFEPLFDVAMKLYEFEDLMFETDEEYLRCAPLVLSYNYRVRVPEMTALKLFTNDNVREIISACADEKNYVALNDPERKKKANVDLITNDGEMGTTPHTSPLLQTS